MPMKKMNLNAMRSALVKACMKMDEGKVGPLTYCQMDQLFDSQKKYIIKKFGQKAWNNANMGNMKGPYWFTTKVYGHVIITTYYKKHGKRSVAHHDLAVSN